MEEFGPEFASLWSRISSCTIVSVERAYATYRACRYAERYGIPGAFVECGVYKGGQAMLAALTLRDRDIWLYDTFEGMTKAGEHDGEAAMNYAAWQVMAGIEEVIHNLGTTGYPRDRLRFVRGDVCQTLRREVPDRIAVLRLDTDWYESTKAELEVLYPKIVPGGVILCDDYGFWRGARKAVDEFIDSLPHPVYLARTDNCGVEWTKPI